MIQKTGTAKHYCWGSNCEGWYLLESAALTIIEERMPPGSAEVKHCHAKSRQFFYVLDGTALMVHDGVSTVLNAFDGLEIAPGVEHQISNHGSADLKILVTSCPPSHGDRFDVL